MNNYQKALIEEHSNLVIRTQNLHNYIYSDESNNDHRIEFANKCIQLASMKKYEEALRARMENANICYEDGSYFEKVGIINPTVNIGSESDNNCEIDPNCKDCNNCKCNE